MTIKVSVTKDEDGSGANVHVAILDRDMFGNPMVRHHGVEQLATGETKEYYITDICELRVYETDKDLVGAG